MPGRPVGLVIAAVLLVVIGVSGLLVGLQLLAIGGLASGTGGEPAAFLIPAGIAAYGAAACVGGFGLFLRRRIAHRLAVVVIAIGLVELAWQTTLIGPDPVTLFAIGLWVVVLGLLLLPGVRSAMADRRRPAGNP